MQSVNWGFLHGLFEARFDESLARNKKRRLQRRLSLPVFATPRIGRSVLCRLVGIGQPIPAAPQGLEQVRGRG